MGRFGIACTELRDTGENRARAAQREQEDAELAVAVTPLERDAIVARFRGMTPDWRSYITASEQSQLCDSWGEFSEWLAAETETDVSEFCGVCAP